MTGGNTQNGLCCRGYKKPNDLESLLIQRSFDIVCMVIEDSFNAASCIFWSVLTEGLRIIVNKV